MRVGEADPNALLDIANHNADVVVLEELTPQLADTLNQTGIKTIFPYQALEPGEYGYGVGIWSRYPITASARIEGYRLKMVSADIAVPGTQQDTVFVAIHLPGPWPQDIDAWREEIERLPTTLGEIKDKANGRPVIVAGDFNATYDMAPFRNLLTNGFADAAEQSGAGITRTFPSDTTLAAALRDRSRPDLQRHSHRRADRQSPRLRSPGTARDGTAYASSVKFRMTAGSTGMPGPVVVDTVIFFR